MAKQSQSKVTNYAMRLKLPFSAVIVIVAGLIVVAWVLYAFIAAQLAISQQQSRFDSVRPVMQSFETRVKQSLGNAVATTNETDSCYDLGQSEAPAPGPSGTLYCGITIRGVTSVLSSSSSTYPEFETAQEIGTLAHESFAASTIDFQESNTANKPGRDGYVYYIDEYYLFHRAMDCQLYVGTTLPPASNSSQIDFHNGQLYFNLTCEQQATKKTFAYVSSPLD